jgi:hypothetical protein
LVLGSRGIIRGVMHRNDPTTGERAALFCGRADPSVINQNTGGNDD